ncbi:hypothetical protein [Actinoplanes aureus]|uniref:hypothetical protein n=1 Tax=Actinoplanes aureus TaxID=2792083 RepID=UPI001E290371|nr:hypothetical protein [Actinoplanes aureus]
MTQAARNPMMDLEDTGCPVKGLICDQDGEHPAQFDTALTDADINVVLSGRPNARMSAAMER